MATNPNIFYFGPLILSGSTFQSANTASVSQYLGGFTGSFDGTASLALHAITASYAVSASHEIVHELSSSFAAFATSASYVNIKGSGITINYSNSQIQLTASAATSTVYSKEIHVSVGSGNDTTGNGTLLKPYATVTKACAVVDGTGQAIVVHPGTYVESPTLTMPNVTVTSINTGGGITLISGTFTISVATSSTRLVGIRATNITKTAAAQLYLHTCQVPGVFANSGTGYCEIIDSDLQGTGINITGASQMVFHGGKQNLITVNNASAIVTVKSSPTCVRPVVTAGTFASFESIIYSTASGSAALTSNAGTAVQLFNTNFYNPVGTPERIAVAGFLGYDNITFNRRSSTVGTSLAVAANFQSLDARTLTATGSLFGASTSARTATSSSHALFANASRTASTASYVANAVVTASIAASTITFNKMNGSSFNIVVPSSGGGTTPISFLYNLGVRSTTEAWTSIPVTTGALSTINNTKRFKVEWQGAVYFAGDFFGEYFQQTGVMPDATANSVVGGKKTLGGMPLLTWDQAMFPTETGKVATSFGTSHHAYPNWEVVGNAFAASYTYETYLIYNGTSFTWKIRTRNSIAGNSNALNGVTCYARGIITYLD